jgi:hypothetical protein
MNLDARLQALESASQIPEPMLPKTSVKGWEPGIVWDGSEGSITTSPLEEEPDPAIWNELIADWGLDPEKTEIVPGSVQVRGWDANVGEGVIKRLRYYRATLRSKVREVDNLHLEELYKDVRKSKPAKKVYGGESSLLVALSDWQVGNRDGGGVQAQAEAIAALVDSIPARVTSLRKMGYDIGHIVIAGMGDLVEGTCGHYPAQPFRVEIDRRDQMKLVRRGVRDIFMAASKTCAKVSGVAIPGNHGENRQMNGGKGSSITSVHDNDDVAVFEQVAEILSMNDAFSNISWRIPRDEIVVSMEISGQICSFTHGHVARMAGGAINTLWKWWEGHAMGRVYPGLAASNVLVTGHYHHFNVKEQESRSLFICPSLTQVGDYFQDSAGVRTKCGTVSMVINEKGWHELTLL